MLPLALSGFQLSKFAPAESALPTLTRLPLRESFSFAFFLQSQRRFAPKNERLRRYTNSALNNFFYPQQKKASSVIGERNS